jgi:hypothetical protein
MDDESQDRAQNGRRFPPHTRRDANRGSQPQARRRRQAVNLLLLTELEDILRILAGFPGVWCELSRRR